MSAATQNAVRLASVDIPKPWGKEVWFTGMEARGESAVVLPSGEHVPLSRYLALDPMATCREQTVLLLKVLDPRPEPVLGDLYFEVHEEKREVYVVTAIADGAQGGIRFGMNQALRQRYNDDDAFRRAYLEAVQRYEAVRRAIDEQGESATQQEAERREAMNSFTAYQPLSVGDVVVVPTWTPHALQHGVRVVEFQTQTYERLILSFAQKVLTQDHWDTQAGVERMHLDPPQPPQFEDVTNGVTRIARFEDFNVWRITHEARTLNLPEHLPYAVAMAIGGAVRVGPLTLAPESAAFVPGDAIAHTSIEPLSAEATCVVAAPTL